MAWAIVFISVLISVKYCSDGVAVILIIGYIIRNEDRKNRKIADIAPRNFCWR